ncbi:hypothetical protein TNCV_4747431 [Trichonephila clavipes]|nr:hypothetical protein TNCV_4747431 [Trichonephila clavipes]
MKIHRLGQGSNSQPWVQKASDKSTTSPSRLKKTSMRMGFEPTQAKNNGLAIHCFNHSATPSFLNKILNSIERTKNNEIESCLNKKKKCDLLKLASDSMSARNIP